MQDTMTIKQTTVRLIRGDITELDIEGFVFYAQPSLKLGSGFGTAISVRGGPSIQKELDGLGTQAITACVTTGAGELKAQHIIHAVGPAFQETDLEAKLRTTILNVLNEADARGLTSLALPAMGAGFYGVPLPLCADVMLTTLTEYFGANNTSLREVVLCVLDNRELKPFQERLGEPATA